MMTATESLAMHEAGHVVAGLCFGIDLNHVALYDDCDGSDGRPHVRWASGSVNLSPLDDLTAHKRACVSLAGPVAKCFADWDLSLRQSLKGQSDYTKAINLVGEDAIPEIALAAASLITGYWDAMMAVWTALERETVLSGAKARAIAFGADRRLEAAFKGARGWS